MTQISIKLMLSSQSEQSYDMLDAVYSYPVETCKFKTHFFFIFDWKDQIYFSPQEAGDSVAQIFIEAVQLTKYKSAQSGH